MARYDKDNYLDSLEYKAALAGISKFDPRAEISEVIDGYEYRLEHYLINESLPGMEAVTRAAVETLCSAARTQSRNRPIWVGGVDDGVILYQGALGHDV